MHQNQQLFLPPLDLPQIRLYRVRVEYPALGVLYESYADGCFGEQTLSYLPFPVYRLLVTGVVDEIETLVCHAVVVENAGHIETRHVFRAPIAHPWDHKHQILDQTLTGRGQ